VTWDDDVVQIHAVLLCTLLFSHLKPAFHVLRVSFICGTQEPAAALPADLRET
jgi:hypothetical protein